MTRGILGFGASAQQPTGRLEARTVAGSIQADASASRVRRDRRDATYIKCVEGLASAATMSALDRAEIEERIAAAFPDPRDLIPDGFVSRCYLGPEYDVHEIDIAGSILRHFLATSRMPDHLAPARRLALHPDYRFIEVYPSRLVCVRHDGSVVELEQ